MAGLFRVFWIWMIFIVLAVGLMLGFEFVNSAVEESGFSSGKVFSIEERGGMIFGEIFGKSFSADISTAEKFFSKAEDLLLFLPPAMQLFLKLPFIIASV